MAKVRKDRGQRLKDVARLLGCRTTTVCAWEQGRSIPKPRFLPGLIAWAQGVK